MSETIWHERLKLSCEIRPFKYSRCKSTVWRCEYYLINRQNYLQCPYCTTRRMIDYTHLRHQRHRKLLLLTIINMQSTFIPAILPNVYRFKKFFTVRLGNKFVEVWLLKMLPYFIRVATLPCLFSDSGVLQGSVATRIRCDGIFSKKLYCKFSDESVMEKLKIGERLMKLLSWVCCLPFYGTRGVE